MSNRQLLKFLIVQCALIFYGIGIHSFDGNWWYAILVGFPLGMITYRLMRSEMKYDAR